MLEAGGGPLGNDDRARVEVEGSSSFEGNGRYACQIANRTDTSRDAKVVVEVPRGGALIGAFRAVEENKGPRLPAGLLRHHFPAGSDDRIGQLVAHGLRMVREQSVEVQGPIFSNRLLIPRRLDVYSGLTRASFGVHDRARLIGR